MSKQKETVMKFSAETLRKIRELEKRNKLEIEVVGNIEAISSGSFKLDLATDIGGIPKGKVVEIFGPESSGKSTITLHIIREYQRALPDKPVALFDYEYSFDPVYAASIGIDVDNLLIYQPDNLEQGGSMMMDFAMSGVVSLCVIDSHSAALPKAMVDAELGKDTMASQARLFAKFLPKIKPYLSESGMTLIGVSQLRDNMQMGGEETKTTGGWSWKFYSDMRLKVWRYQKKDEKAEQYTTTHVDVQKNKCGKPFGAAEFEIEWGKGINNQAEILDMAIELGIIRQAGSWYSCADNKLGQGRDAVLELFRDNPAFYQDIKSQVTKSLEGEEEPVTQAQADPKAA